MAIYDVAAAINTYKADPAGSLQEGLSAGNAIYEMRRRRQAQVEDEKIRNGLMQFYRLGQPAQTVTDVQGPDIGAMVGQGASMGQMGGQGMMADAGKYLPRADYLGSPETVMPQMQKREIPAVAGGMDYQGAADYLASQGRFEQAGQLAGLRDKMSPQSLNWTGVIKEAEDAEGNPVMLGMTNQGARPIEGYRPRPAAPKAPQTRTLKIGGREITQEWDGSKYVNIAEAPREMPKPEKPDVLDLKDRAQIEQSYRKEFNSLNAAYTEIKRSRGNILSSLEQNTAAGDLGAATSLMKMLDPGSVVRESELAMAQNATGALDKVYNYAQLIANGQRLNPTQRAEYVSLANDLFSNSETDYKSRVGEYTRIAADYGLKPENIVGTQLAAPKLGEKKNGYVFIGGDPANPKSWRQAK